jgi:toxin ParE1/3/4
VIEIVLSRRAREDFKRIWRFIAADNEAAADKLLLAIDKSIERLRRHPEIGRKRNDIRPGARMLVYGNYIVLYEFRRPENTVEIVAVVEGMRDLEYLF